MKKIFALLFAFVALFSVTSCDGDEPNPDNGSKIDPTKPVADPDGTITLSMRDYDSGDTRILDYLGIRNENFTSYYYDYYDDGVKIATVGAVTGLGNVSKIPTTGWADAVAVIPGNGYVAYIKGTFVRIYVVDFITNTAGGIIGAEVKYQYPFKGLDEALQLEKSTVTLPSVSSSDHISVTNSSFIPFDISTDVSWLYVEKTSSYTTHVLYNGVNILAGDNTQSISREGTVTLTTLYGKTAKIKVTQAGKIEQFLDAAPYSNSAVRVDASGDDLVSGFKDENTGENTGIVSVETTEDGKLILGVLPGTPLDKGVAQFPGIKKKDISSLLRILFFDCTLNGTTYQIGTYGTLTIIREGSTFTFVLKLFGYEFTFKATPVERLSNGDRTTSLARDWKVKESQAQTMIGVVTVARNFTGCNLNEIEAWVIKQGVHIADNDKLPAKSNITCLGFTNSKTYYIKYGNGTVDVADWRWINEMNGDLGYNWRRENMGNTYEAGACTAKFYNGNCELSIEATIHGADGNTHPFKLRVTLID